MERTLESILEWFQSAVKDKQPISPHLWCEAAADLNILRGDEDDRLCEMEQEVAKLKVSYLEQKTTAIESKTRVEATDTFKEMRRLKAKIGRIEEFVRLGKLMARLKSEEIKGV